MYGARFLGKLNGLFHFCWFEMISFSFIFYVLQSFQYGYTGAQPTVDQNTPKTYYIDILANTETHAHNHTHPHKNTTKVEPVSHTALAAAYSYSGASISTVRYAVQRQSSLKFLRTLHLCHKSNQPFTATSSLCGLPGILRLTNTLCFHPTPGKLFERQNTSIKRFRFKSQ